MRPGRKKLGVRRERGKVTAPKALLDDSELTYVSVVPRTVLLMCPAISIAIRRRLNVVLRDTIAFAGVLAYFNVSCVVGGAWPCVSLSPLTLVHSVLCQPCSVSYISSRSRRYMAHWLMRLYFPSTR